MFITSLNAQNDLVRIYTEIYLLHTLKYSTITVAVIHSSPTYVPHNV